MFDELDHFVKFEVVEIINGVQDYFHHFRLICIDETYRVEEWDIIQGDKNMLEVGLEIYFNELSTLCIIETFYVVGTFSIVLLRLLNTSISSTCCS